MLISIHEFWKLAVESRLLTPARAKELHATFTGLKGAQAQANVRSLAQWLIAQRALTVYQASALGAGRAGPFVLGEYVIYDRIESGRLAGVYRATHQGARRVLLLFASQVTGDPEHYPAPAETAQQLSAIDSPHVSVIERFVSAGASSFMVLGDLAGQTLGELLTQKRITGAEACRIAFQAGLGLLSIHKATYLHGDLRPNNIWVEPSGSVKLLHFPLVATPAETRDQPTQADYQAPELHRPEHSPDTLTDIYSLGATIYELIAGRVIFPGGSVEQKKNRHESEIPQRLDQIVLGTPEPLARLVAEMLDKEPLLRCQSATQVVHVLAPLAAGIESADLVPPEVGSQAIRAASGRAAPPQVSADPAMNAPPVEGAKPTETPHPPAKPSLEPVPHPARAASSKPTGEPTAAKAIVRPMHPERSNSSQPPLNATPTSAPGDKSESAADSRKKNAAVHRSAKPRDRESIVMSESTEERADQFLAEGDFDFEPPVALADDLPLVRRPAKPTCNSKSTLLIFAAAVTVVAVVVFVGLLLSSGQSEKPSAAARVDTAEQPAASTERTVVAEASKLPASDSPPRNDVASDAQPVATSIEDDGETLWISPTAGPPLEFNYLPSGAQVILVLRLAELLATAEGAKLLDALGPAGELAKARLRAILGVELAEVEQLTISFSPDDAGSPQAAYVMRLTSPFSEEKLLEAWGRPRKEEVGSKSFFQAARFAYYLPPESGQRVVAVAAPEQMKEILELDGTPLVRKGIERLLRQSDGSRHVNLLLAPSYLLTDGKSLLVGDLEKVRDPLALFLDESFEAVLASAYLGDELFLEFRALGPVDQPAAELAKRLRARLERLPEQVEAYVASLQPRPYGRLIVMRFPRMVQLLSDFTRAGAEGRQAVLRCYLPIVAAHNLLLGTELTLFEEPTTGGISEPKLPSADSGSAVATAALRKTISLSFPRDTLERCLEMLSKEIDVEVAILGNDLQAEGITKNQSFGLDERNQTAGEILQKVLQLANSAGKLVYVIKSKDDGKEAILITTRAAAAKRGDRLPAEFSAKEPDEKP